MRELGSSNKLFYYTFAGRGTFDMQVIMDLRSLVKPELLKLALTKAVPLFPELAIRVHRHNKHLVMDTNPKEVKVMEEDDKIHYFMNPDTNEYLFYFSYRDNRLKFSCYHGLTDFRGYMTFLRTVLLFYGMAEERVFTEEELATLKGNVRLSKNDISADEEEAYNPYVRYTKGVEIKDSGLPLAAAAIHTEQYPDESSELNCYEITCNNTQYRKLVKDLQTSSASLLAAIVSSATFKLLPEEENKPVVAMLPIDLRSLFGSTTMVNFSDGIFLPLERSDLTLSISERSAKIKALIKKGINKEYFEAVMAGKVEQVKMMEESDDVMKIIEHNVAMAPKGSFTPLTYALTFPGNLSMGEPLDKMLEDVSLLGFARASSAIASAFGDKLRVLLAYRSDDPSWPNAILSGFKSLNLDAKMEYKGKLKGDVIIPEDYLKEE